MVRKQWRDALPRVRERGIRTRRDPSIGCGFTYGGKRYDAGAFAKGAAVELGGGVRVTLERHEWPEADAAEWLMWFENTGMCLPQISRMTQIL